MGKLDIEVLDKGIKNRLVVFIEHENNDGYK